MSHDIDAQPRLRRRLRAMSAITPSPPSTFELTTRARYRLFRLDIVDYRLH